MSVTILNEIEKAETRIAGLRKNLNKVKPLNITTEGLEQLEQHCKTLKQKNEELDALRRQEAQKVRENHELLDTVKSQMLTYRKAIKGQYPQEEWIHFGVQDKR